MSSISNEKKDEVTISGEYATPAITDLGILASIKMLSQTKVIAQGNDSLAKIAQEEIKYLEAAMLAIARNSQLASAYGSGFEGVTELAGILKARQSKRLFEDVLNDVLEKADQDPSKSLNGQFDLKGIKAKQGYRYVK